MSSIRANAAAHYVNFIVQAALNIIVSPHLMAAMGVANFGVWKACQKYLDFAATADGRSTQALKWVIAHGHASATDDQKRRDLGAGVVVWALWLPLVVSIVAAIVVFIPNTIDNLTAEQADFARQGCLVLGISVVLSTLLGIPDAVLIGTNQGWRSTSVTTLVITITNLSLLILARSTPSVGAVALITASGTVLNGGLTWIVAKRYVAWWRISKPRWQDVKTLSKFSSWVMVWQFIQLLLMTTDFILISIFFGAAGITAYTFTYYISQSVLSICQLTTSAVSPKIGSLLGSGDTAGADQLVRQNRELILIFSTVGAGIMLMLNLSFVHLWAGPEAFLGLEANAIMALSLFQLALIRCEAQFQDASLDIRSKVLWGAVASASSVAFGAWAYAAFSSLPATLGGAFAGRMIATVVYPLLSAKRFPTARQSIRGLLAAVVALSACAAIGLHIELRSWFSLVIVGIASAALLVSFAILTIASTSTKIAIYKILPSKLRI